MGITMSGTSVDEKENIARTVLYCDKKDNIAHCKTKHTIWLWTEMASYNKLFVHYNLDAIKEITIIRL